MKTSAVIPLIDYLRIFNMTRAVLDGLNADTVKACTFFSAAGAAVLRNCYKKDAVAVAGAAFYNVSTTVPHGLAFAHVDERGGVSSSDDAFHAWIVCDGFVIDFAAPLFPEYYAEFGSKGSVPRKMFQKPLSVMTPLVGDFTKLGDFSLHPDRQLTAEVQEMFASSMAEQDFVNACVRWYRRPPLTMPSRFSLKNDEGEVVKLQMQDMQLSGAW